MLSSKLLIALVFLTFMLITYKFAFHTKCVFIGYIDVHKGYKCLDSFGCVYITYHVVFNEMDTTRKHVFPNENLGTN